MNNEGDTPIDIEGTEDAITTMLQDSIDKHNIDMDAVRRAEEMLMLDDAKRLKNDPGLKPVISIGGATPLHVAASKNYLQVLRCVGGGEGGRRGGEKGEGERERGDGGVSE